MFDHQEFNKQAISSSTTINDAESYGLRIVDAEADTGETYWKVVGVHHLTPDENRSNHHVYVDVLDEAGERITGPNVWIGWTWEGRRDDEPANPVPADKPAAEPAGNIAVFKGQRVSVWVKGTSADAQDKSDRVEGVHTEHPDEPLADGTLWNTIGHHSFYVVFQRTVK